MGTNLRPVLACAELLLLDLFPLMAQMETA